MSDAVTIILLIAILLLAAGVLPQLLLDRAIRSVIRIFRHHNAIGIGNAKTVSELGLSPQPFFARMWKTRDYKPRALQLLRNASIVQTTEEGKLYLSAEDLATSKWKSI